MEKSISLDTSVINSDAELVDIKRKALRPVKLTAECKKCGGAMVCTQTLMSLPPKYVHECSSCLLEEVLSVSYPTIGWEEVENAED